MEASNRRQNVRKIWQTTISKPVDAMQSNVKSEGARLQFGVMINP